MGLIKIEIKPNFELKEEENPFKAGKNLAFDDEEDSNISTRSHSANERDPKS
jgi:hypothetical protein